MGLPCAGSQGFQAIKHAMWEGRGGKEEGNRKNGEEEGKGRGREGEEEGNRKDRGGEEKGKIRRERKMEENFSREKK